MADLGQKYRDSVTGYTGVATAKTEYMYDAPSVRLTCIGKDGRPEDTWFSEGRLEPANSEKAGAGFLRSYADMDRPLAVD